jgi:hypothetical protein
MLFISCTSWRVEQCIYPKFFAVGRPRKIAHAAGELQLMQRDAPGDLVPDATMWGSPTLTIVARNLASLHRWAAWKKLLRCSFAIRALQKADLKVVLDASCRSTVTGCRLL